MLESVYKNAAALTEKMTALPVSKIFSSIILSIAIKSGRVKQYTPLIIDSYITLRTWSSQVLQAHRLRAFRQHRQQ